MLNTKIGAKQRFLIAIIIGTVIGLYAANYYSGFFPVPSQVDAVSIGTCPVIDYLTSDPPQLITYSTSMQGSFQVVQCWYNWNHDGPSQKPDWEPVYVYYSVVPTPLLIAVASRVHYTWVVRRDGFIPDSGHPQVYFSCGEQIIIGCSLNTDYHTPITGQAFFSPLIKPQNFTTTLDYTALCAGCPVSDQGLSQGETAPGDPWLIFNDPSQIYGSLLIGTLFGGIVDLAAFFVLGGRLRLGR